MFWIPECWINFKPRQIKKGQPKKVTVGMKENPQKYNLFTFTTSI